MPFVITYRIVIIYSGMCMDTNITYCDYLQVNVLCDAQCISESKERNIWKVKMGMCFNLITSLDPERKKRIKTQRERMYRMQINLSSVCL